MVYALAVNGNDLYAGGYFRTAGGTSANYIAKWDGYTWSALGSGVNGTVLALAVSGSDLYVGGIFTTAGGITANGIAKWNGSTWSALGNVIVGQVFALAVSGSDVYVGGTIFTENGIHPNGIAKWDGSSWSALGSGVPGSVLALAVSGDDVYVGGRFETAGSKPSNHIALWHGGTTTPNVQCIQQDNKLVGSGAVGNANQGVSVSISAAGNTAIVSGPLDAGAGAAWVYTRANGVWSQQGNKLVGTGAVGDATQGRSVSLSADGNTAIVGGFSDNAFAGAAWVYTRTNGGVEPRRK